MRLRAHLLPLLGTLLIYPAAMPATLSRPPSAATCAVRADTPVAEIPFVLSGDHVMLQTSVNGHLGWLVLDTGSSTSSLDAAWADTAAHVRVTSTGATVQGTASVRVSTGEVDSLRVGTVELGRTSVALIPMDGIVRARGTRLHGSLGYDFISRYVVEIDYAARRLRLYRPGGWTYRGGGLVVPVSMPFRIPIVQTMVTPPGRAPIPARLVLDLGSANFAVRLFSPFVAAHGLASAPGIDAPIGTGVGGTIVGRVGRLDSARVGALRIVRPTVAMALRPEGFFGTTLVDGTLGSPVYRRTRLILDYARSRVIFEPGSGFDAPYEADMSGLSLAGAPGEPITVTHVVAGSPASQASIAPGDTLVTFDGAAATPAALDEIRAALRSAPGATHCLTLRRGGETREVMIRLRTLV